MVRQMADFVSILWVNYLPFAAKESFACFMTKVVARFSLCTETRTRKKVIRANGQGKNVTRAHGNGKFFTRAGGHGKF